MESKIVFKCVKIVKMRLQMNKVKQLSKTTEKTFYTPRKAAKYLVIPRDNKSFATIVQSVDRGHCCIELIQRWRKDLMIRSKIPEVSWISSAAFRDFAITLYDV